MKKIPKYFDLGATIFKPISLLCMCRATKHNPKGFKMIKAQQTAAYLDALANGAWETWVKDTAVNPQSKMVVNHNGKRFDVESRRQVTVKELTEGKFRKR